MKWMDEEICVCFDLRIVCVVLVKCLLAQPYSAAYFFTPVPTPLRLVKGIVVNVRARRLA